MFDLSSMIGPENISEKRMRDSLQKSSTEFYKGLSHWLYLSLTNPEKKQYCKQTDQSILMMYGGYLLYKVAFNWCIVSSLYYSICIRCSRLGMEEHLASDYSYALAWLIKLDDMGNSKQVELVVTLFS